MTNAYLPLFYLFVLLSFTYSWITYSTLLSISLMQKTLTQSMTQLPLGADWTIIRQHRSLGTAERIESDLLNTFNVRMRRQDTSDAQLQLDKEIAKMKEIENYRTAQYMDESMKIFSHEELRERKSSQKRKEEKFKNRMVSMAEKVQRENAEKEALKIIRVSTHVSSVCAIRIFLLGSLSRVKMIQLQLNWNKNLCVCTHMRAFLWCAFFSQSQLYAVYAHACVRRYVRMCARWNVFLWCDHTVNTSVPFDLQVGNTFCHVVLQLRTSQCHQIIKEPSSYRLPPLNFECRRKKKFIPNSSW